MDGKKTFQQDKDGSTDEFGNWMSSGEIQQVIEAVLLGVSNL